MSVKYVHFSLSGISNIPIYYLSFIATIFYTVCTYDYHEMQYRQYLFYVEKVFFNFFFRVEISRGVQLSGLYGPIPRPYGAAFCNVPSTFFLLRYR